MSKFSVKPTLSLKNRKFKGLRGWAGKPLHPPLTDIPVAAYLIAAGFDVASVIGGHEHQWARELWHAGTFVFVTGFVVSVFAAITGLLDSATSSEAGTQARRTINTHAALMVTGTVLAVLDLVWRLSVYNTAVVAPGPLAILSGIIALVISVGATFGGAMVFEYGFNVETAGDHPAWHKSDTDVFHGEH